jgi:DNA polymerase (family 10)
LPERIASQMNNVQIAEIFENIAGLLEIKGEQRFVVVSYQRAARAIDHLSTEIEQMLRDEEDLTEISGVGKAIAGKMDFYEKLRGEFPDGILDVMHVPGVGPKSAKRLWEELDVTTVEKLEEVAKDGRLASLPRMGQKKADNILKEIAASRTKDDRVPIARALPAAERVIAALRERCPSIVRLEAAGSLRRFEETIGDIDLVCTSTNPQEVLDALVELPNVTNVLAHGEKKSSVVLSEGVQVDLRVVDDSQYGSLLQYFSGDKQHNIRLRELAQRQGLSVNEYGIKDNETEEIESFTDEQSLYERLGLQYIPPELRRGGEEIDRAKKKDIPRLIEVGDLKGDLHVHTEWSDGRDPTELMVVTAQERGYEYVAITDHSVGRGIANGLNEERLHEHIREIRELEQGLGSIKILAGSEVDIRADGSLDYPDDLLNHLDWVVASVHSAMGQDAETMTARIIKAMHNPHVTAIGHLTTRMIGERKPIEADFEAIFRAAAETGTALEINASPQRLDLKDIHAHRARELGVPLVIDSDAHRTESLDNQRYGVAVARRAWCESKHILNTLPLDAFMGYLSLEKSKRSRFLAEHG